MAETTSSTPFPDILAPKEVKVTQDYGLKYAKALYGYRLANQSAYNEIRRIFLRNREYSEGLQSIQNVKDRKGITDTSYLNLDFRPVNIIATTLDNIVGKLSKIEYVPICTPLDSESKNEKDQYRNKLKANRFLKSFSDEAQSITGMPLIDKGMKTPESDEEEEIFMQMDFKWASSIAMEEGLSFVLFANMFPEVKERVIRDLFENKVSAIRTYYDEDYNIKYKREDFLDLIVPYSKTEDFDNMVHFGLFKYFTLGEIARKGNFSQDQLFDIGKLNAGQNGNSAWTWGDDYQSSTYYNNTSEIPRYYSFLITVLDFEFLGIDKEVREFKSKKRRKYLNDVPSNESTEGRDGEIISRTMEYRYEGQWVVGTDYMIKYGKSKNVPRERISGSYSPKSCLSLSIVAPNLYNMKNKSHVERMIPHEEQIQLAHLGLQAALIKAKPNGVAIDVRGLADAALALGENMKPIDIIKIYEATGNLIYSSSDAEGEIVNSKVITELRGGVGTLMSEFIGVYQFERQLINEVIGYNSVVDGSTPSSNMLVGVQKNAIEATNNSLAPLFNAHLKLVGMANKKTALMIQDCIQHNNEAFINAIGAQSTTVLELGKNLAFIQMGIDIELLPDEQEKLEINEQIRLGQQSTPPLLTPSDAIRIRQAMKKNAKLAAKLLSYLEDKNSKARMQESLALQKANADTQIQSTKASTEGAIQIDNTATENKKALLEFEYSLKSKFSAQEHQQNMQLTQAESMQKVNMNNANNQTKVVVQDMVNQGNIEEKKLDMIHDHAISDKEHEQNMSQEALKALVNKKEKSESK